MEGIVSSKLRRFIIHGAAFRGTSGETQVYGDCPFCGRQGKFYVNKDTLLWDCKVCQRKGDFQKFLGEVAERNADRLLRDPQAQRALAKDRGLKRATLLAAQVGFFGGVYTVPIRTEAGNLIDLQRYRMGGKLQSSLGGKKGLWGVHKLRQTTDVWLTEGFWDGLAGEELLEKSGLSDRTDILAAPGADVFSPKWAGFFVGRNVYVPYDNDGKEQQYAAQKGMRRVYALLKGGANSLHFVHWPQGTPRGFDLRDYHHKNKTARNLLSYMQDKPPGIPSSKKEPRKSEQGRKTATKRISRKALIREFQHWLYLTEDEVEVLDVIFGAIYANRGLEGDPIWLFLVGPPGCGKTELILTLNKSDNTVATTTVSRAALVSGAQMKDGADPSLLPKLHNKIWCIKDFTTLLSAPQATLNEVFGILRDAYDGSFIKPYGTGIVRDYECKFGIIAGVTHHINAFQQNSAVGERFIRYNLRHKAQDAGSEALISAAMRNINTEEDMRASLQKVAKRAADASINWLPDRTEFWDKRIIPLSQWVAFMRGAVMRHPYSDEVIYAPSAEVGTRIAKQLTKLGMGIALFRNQRTFGESVYRIIIKVARDSAPDRAELIIRNLHVHKEALTASTLSDMAKLETATCLKVLRDMRLLKIVDKVKGTNQWKMTARMRQLIRKSEVYWEEDKWMKAVEAHKKSPKRKEKKWARRKKQPRHRK